MHMLMTRLTGALLACAALNALPAAAQITSTVSASNIRVLLTDLNPNDGLAPWFAFDDAVLPSLSLSTSVTPTPDSAHHDYTYDERSGNFTFSAYTEVSLLMDVDIAMLASPSPQQYQYGTAWISFRASAVWGPPRDRWPRDDSETESRYVGQEPFGPYWTEVNRQLTLPLMFTNDTGYAASGYFRVMAESESYTMASPVPEAPAPAMLACGIAVLGVIARRRGRRDSRGALHTKTKVKRDNANALK